MATTATDRRPRHDPVLPLSEAGRLRAEARAVVQAVYRLGEHVVDVPIRMVPPAGRRIHEFIPGPAVRHNVGGAVVGWPNRRGPSCPPGVTVAGRILRGRLPAHGGVPG